MFHVKQLPWSIANARWFRSLAEPMMIEVTTVRDAGKRL